ncbi:hypothetical protein A5853_000444 [Enterococcus faecium]|nr:hypothetical protein [Enterococcus faecium]OTO92197.1 hypothetical protein A5853_000444 [Enterococcus faecium]
MKDTVTIIKSNLNYQQAIFSLLALNSLSNDYICLLYTSRCA